MSAPEIITFGCRLNAFESEVMRDLARGPAASPGPDARHTIIVNTCAVTAEAERQARQAVRRARRERPDARIVVTGCAAQIDPGAWAAMPGVDRVLGNDEKLTPALLDDDGPPVAVADIMAVRRTAPHLIAGFEGRARAFVEVQNGCDHRCTFCIIPFGRGNSRSVPLGRVVEQVRLLVDNGYREVVLTGVDLTAWGTDLPGRPAFSSLLRRLLDQVPALPRLRLGSVDVAEADDGLLRLLADEPRLMPHLHLSLQAGDDMILTRMKRRHRRADAVEFCRRARELRPDIVFGADLIAGFPTETDEMFDNTLRLVDDCGLVWLHVFPYSARPGTPAARMPAVPGDVARARARRLREAGAEARDRWLAGLTGGRQTVLLETPTLGRTGGYATVRLDAANTEGTAGTLREAIITGAADGGLDGRLAA